MSDVISRHLLQVFVKQTGIDVTTIPELADMSATPDHDHLNAVCESDSCQTFFSQLVDFVDQVRAGCLGKTAQFWVSYYDCVCTLLLFQQAITRNDLELYVDCLQQMCALITAADRVNCARYLPLYHYELGRLQSDNPSRYAQLANKGITVARSVVPGCRNAVDLTIEQTINRSAKTVGGIVGFSRNHHAYYRWCLTRHWRTSFVDCPQ